MANMNLTAPGLSKLSKAEDNRIFRASTKRAVNVDERTAEFVISTPARDSHGTIILATAWRFDRYNKNNIVPWMHNVHPGFLTSSHDPDNIIGTGEVYHEGENLIGRVTFETEDVNPLAEKIFRKIQSGTIKGASVGFIPKAGHWGKKENGEDERTYYFDDVELSEFSIVTVPSNPDAVLRSAKAVQRFAGAPPMSDERRKYLFERWDQQAKEEHENTEQNKPGLRTQKARLNYFNLNKNHEKD